jgi:hypothetical protein
MGPFPSGCDCDSSKSTRPPPHPTPPRGVLHVEFSEDLVIEATSGIGCGGGGERRLRTRPRWLAGGRAGRQTSTGRGPSDHARCQLHASTTAESDGHQPPPPPTRRRVVSHLHGPMTGVGTPPSGVRVARQIGLAGENPARRQTMGSGRCGAAGVPGRLSGARSDGRRGHGTMRDIRVQEWIFRPCRGCGASRDDEHDHGVPPEDAETSAGW